jgi:GrpB-like predicted nucleotidyltransferase (UPF0157 family)
MIVILNGPLGIGKTETSWELLRLFEHAIMLDGDYLGAVQPFEIYDEDRVNYLYQTIRLLVTHHRQHGYQDFIINYVFETPESLRQLRQMLVDLDDVDYAFRLTCSEGEIARRINQRSADPDSLDWELQRFRQLVAIQEAAAGSGDLGFPIDTTHLTAKQTARQIWENIHEEVCLAAYDPAWPERFAQECAQIRAALEGLALEVHHIGSTAIPRLSAKPVIDVLVLVRQLEDAVACIPPLAMLGYQFVDYAGNTNRKFFRKGVPRTHHVHIMAYDDPHVRDYLDFRDALRQDAALHQAYEELKRSLSQRFPADRAKYSASKSDFIRQVLDRWRKSPIRYNNH